MEHMHCSCKNWSLFLVNDGRNVLLQVNQVEAEYWRKSEGIRVGWSDEILGFDCGGQQWVSEICFPTGTIKKPNMQDVKYIEQLMNLIKKEDIPAPSPIEQRWTARSQSPLSPAFSTDPDALSAWVSLSFYENQCKCTFFLRWYSHTTFIHSSSISNSSRVKILRNQET